MNRRSFLKATISGLLACGLAPEAMAGILNCSIRSPSPHEIKNPGDYFQKMKHSDRPHPDDRYLGSDKCRILTDLVF